MKFLAYLYSLAAVLFTSSWVRAEGEAAAAQAAPNAFMQMVPLLLVFVVFYFLLIRPQQKKMRDQQEMLKALKNGDQVVTSSGIIGKITNIADSIVTLEISEAVRIQLLKSQVAQVVKGPLKDSVKDLVIN
jgi:preprotein translocase subunit YajC